MQESKIETGRPLEAFSADLFHNLNRFDEMTFSLSWRQMGRFLRAGRLTF